MLFKFSEMCWIFPNIAQDVLKTSVVLGSQGFTSSSGPFSRLQSNSRANSQQWSSSSYRNQVQVKPGLQQTQLRLTHSRLVTDLYHLWLSSVLTVIDNFIILTLTVTCAGQNLSNMPEWAQFSDTGLWKRPKKDLSRPGNPCSENINNNNNNNNNVFI